MPSPLPRDAARLGPDGYLGRWQARNAEATLPHCIGQLETGGALGNLRRAAGRSDEPYRGQRFADSDVYKTLEAALWELDRSDDAKLRAWTAETTDLLGAVQQPDGYLNSWMQILHPDQQWADLKWGHELYCAGHLIQAAVAAARTGAAPGLVAIARRVADLLVERFGPDGRPGLCGHPEVETALVELFRATGERSYLDLAARMIELRGHGHLDAISTDLGSGFADVAPSYFQDHAPVRSAPAATGHAVRQLYLEAGVVDVAVELGDAELLAASEALWDDLYSSKTYLTGGHGSRHRDEAIGDPYELPPDRAYAETCAAIAAFGWNWRLLLATGRARYAHEMERVLYNAVAVATAVDGRHFFYSNPLQLRAGHDGADEDAPARRLAWYSCACCPPNLARLIANLHTYVATGDDSGVALHLYSDADIDVGAIRLRVRTTYPWTGAVTVEVDCSSGDQWCLSLRVPAGTAAPVVVIDDEPQLIEAADGYLRIRRQWPERSIVRVEFDMTTRIVGAHPHVDAVRGCVALVRGPLVFCFEDVDLPEDVALADVLLAADAPIEAVLTDGVLDVPVVLAATGAVRPPDEALYRRPGAAARPDRPIPLRAVPYYRWGNRDASAMRVWIPAG